MKTVIMLIITMAIASGSLYGEDTTQPPPTPSEEQPEVLTRGPVHEAFAEPVDLNTQPSLVAPAQPPANITENLPAERPTGEQFVWIPGYWAWDSDRNGYIWVSGCWRAAPPSRYWVPGYWSQTDMGWAWVPGFWAQVSNVQQIEYLPAPPAIADVAPPGPPLTDDNIWVPPCWYWYQGRYVWRPGYWIVAQDGWVWAPSHYVCTPRGYVFVTGCWDYSLRRRGVLFAPVYFPRHVYERPGFSYSLSIAVDIGNLEFGLFTCPRYSHYYFGDYYDNVYIGIGIFPWYECRTRHFWYDPIYEHDRWRHHKVDRDWDEHERHEYDRRRDDRDLRTPRTYREMKQRMDKMPEARRKDIRIADTMDKVVADRKAPMKFESIRSDARQKLSKDSTDVRKFRDDRSRWESSPAINKPGSINIERRGPAIQPTGQKGTITAPAEHRQPITQPPKVRDQAPPPTNLRTTGTDVTKSERVNIPSPPIVGKREGFFRTSPSQPAAEKKTDVKHTPRNDDSSHDKDASGSNDTPRNNDSPREKGTHGEKSRR